MLKHLFQTVALLILLLSELSLGSPGIDSCDYYDELEQKVQCGQQGYLQAFASPYCQAYLARNKQFSVHGQNILRSIRTCLQVVLRENAESMSCSEIKEYGIASHEFCYLRSGYCELDHADQLNVFWIARNEAFNPEIWALFIAIQGACVESKIH
jgi:hypothetical protein